MNYEKLNDIFFRTRMLRKKVTEEIESAYAEQVKALQDECAKTTGHNYNFFSRCTACEAMQETKGEKL